MRPREKAATMNPCAERDPPKLFTWGGPLDAPGTWFRAAAGQRPERREEDAAHGVAEHDEEPDRDLRIAPFGIVSGMGYGFGTLLLIDVSEASGTWPIAGQRSAAFLTIAAFALIRRRPFLPPIRFAPQAGVAGLIATMASVFLLTGLSMNPAATSVTATLYPATSVAAGRAFFGDSVSRIQVMGLIVVIVGTVAIVLA